MYSKCRSTRGHPVPRLLDYDCTMAEQQDRELIMIMSDASNSDSDEDEPVIVLADVSVTQPVRVLMSVLHDAKEEDIIKSSSLGPAV